MPSSVIQTQERFPIKGLDTITGFIWKHIYVGLNTNTGVTKAHRILLQQAPSPVCDLGSAAISHGLGEEDRKEKVFFLTPVQKSEWSRGQWRQMLGSNSTQAGGPAGLREGRTLYLKQRSHLTHTQGESGDGWAVFLTDSLLYPVLWTLTSLGSIRHGGAAVLCKNHSH